MWLLFFSLNQELTTMETSNILSEDFINSYRDKQVPWGYNGLGYIVYKRTYARLKEDGQTEDWHETIGRCINGAQRIGAKYTEAEAKRLFDYMFNMKCLFPGRMLWQLGTNTVERFGLPSLCNCWFITMHEPESFCFLFEHLMLGGGVGFSIRREHIHELPKIKTDIEVTHELTKDAHFIVPDSREGWVSLLRKVLNSYFTTGKSFTYSTILIRGAGEAIKGFGGTASGPQILVEGINKIINVLKSREGKKLRSIDVLDINNIIGSIVVAGNVRRSAQIAIGDPDDYLFLRAKRWDLGTIPNWRAMSNNSIYADSYDQISNEVWKGYEGNGEPYGFVNIKLAQTMGRLGEPKKDTCMGLNPCAEATIEHGEPCDLAEQCLNNIDSKEELIDCSLLLYKTCKAVLTLRSISKVTEEVVKRNMRIGLSVTGVCQSLHKLEWLDAAYQELKAFDEIWSDKHGLARSIRLTVVKPSGTVSLLSGSTPGVHPAFSKYYLRTIRMASTDSLVKVCREMNYKVEYALNYDNTENRDTVVVYFPCYAGDDVVFAKDMSAVKQLELVKKLQTTWADQAVSVTVYYKKEELDSIKEWLSENFETSLKSVSFLLHSDHGFKQAPYTEITKSEYDALSSKIKPIKEYYVDLGEMLEGLECINGACPVK
jgi:ribonucleoside-triphosphate reductase